MMKAHLLGFAAFLAIFTLGLLITGCVRRHDPGLELIDAAGQGNLTRVKSLLQEGAPINQRHPFMFAWTPLIAATYHHQDDVIRYLVESGADVNLADSSGVTPLMWLTYDGDQAVPLVKFLIAHGANLDAKDRDGLTVLGHAQGDPPAPKLIATLEEALAERNISRPPTMPSPSSRP